jgi:putative CocE/NonD family hydrolase
MVVVQSIASEIDCAHADQRDGVSAHDKVQVLSNLRVRMRDGVELAVHITRPDAAGRFPALMSYNPYRVLTSFKAAASAHEYSNSVNGPSYLAEHGYISVNYDVRGTGASGGSSPDMYSDAERQDGYDMVEWIAKQPWSNGNVGMWGISYGGVATWQVAALAPPHLKAIIVGDGTEDDYGDWTYPGGVPRPLVFGGYAASMAASNFAPPDPESTGEKWADTWEEHLQNNIPWSIAFLKHQTDGPYWRARSVRPDYSRIKCAVFVIAGWAGWYPTAELRAFANLQVPKRALIGPWGHSWPEDAFPGPRIDGRPEYLKWFDQFLKGINTGVLNEPPVTIFVNQYQAPAPMYKEQIGFWRHEGEWPLARTHYTPMYLGSQNRLERQADVTHDPERDSYPYRASVGAMTGILAEAPWLTPQDQRQDETYSLTYTSPPLEADLEVTGNPTADLFVSSTANIAYFVVRVCDVAPDGTSKLVTDGALNATQRDSRSKPEPIKPGYVYELKFALRSIGYIFPSAHRIRVDIASADFLNALPVSKTAVNAVIRGAQYPSRVILPVAPLQNPLLPKANLQPSPNPLPDFVAKPEGEHNITYDPINQTTTYSMGQGANHTTYTVSDLNPSETLIKSDAEYMVSRPEGEFKLNVHAVTSSDAKVFRHIIDVEVTVDGKHHFSKSWQISEPRVLN